MFTSPGIKSINFSSKGSDGIRELLQGVYSLYGEYVSKSRQPEIGPDGCGDLFKSKVDTYIETTQKSLIL